MECSIILLLVTVGFLCEYTGADSPTNQPNEKKIEEMNATIIQLQDKVDELEKILYKALPRENNSESVDVCSLNNSTKCSDGEKNCTSIDLLAEESKCYMCFSNTWISFNPCIVHHETKIELENDKIGINITIYKRGVIMPHITNKAVAVKCKALKSNCLQSKYKYTQTNGLTVHEQNLFLFCELDVKDPKFNELYCLNATNNTAECYERKGNCTVKDQKLICKTKKYNDTTIPDFEILNQDCGKIKELSTCNIIVNVTNDDININNGTWKDGNANISSCLDLQHPCVVRVGDLCKKEKSLKNCDKIPTEVPTDGSGSSPPPSSSDGNDKGSNYTWFLIIIIVVLLLLLVSYYGYQNQWHHKINTCAEPESNPGPTNRRGRMKGKYAPLPRVMEETIPRHND